MTCTRKAQKDGIAAVLMRDNLKVHDSKKLSCIKHKARVGVVSIALMLSPIPYSIGIAKYAVLRAFFGGGVVYSRGVGCPVIPKKATYKARPVI